MRTGRGAANLQPLGCRFVQPAPAASDDERAVVAAKIATLPRGRPDEMASNDAFSDARAVAALSVSEPSVERANHVLRDGATELQEVVERRELTVSAAVALSALLKAEQEFFTRGTCNVARHRAKLRYV